MVRHAKGFTIVELLIVIVVIGILAALVLNSFTGAQAKARDSRRATDITAIKKAIELYKAENSVYPAVCGADNSGCSASLLATPLTPYTQNIPQDPQLPSRRYDYVRGPIANDSYALYVRYEAKPACKTGNNVNAGWWGSGVAVC